MVGNSGPESLVYSLFRFTSSLGPGPLDGDVTHFAISRGGCDPGL